MDFENTAHLIKDKNDENAGNDFKISYSLICSFYLSLALI
jgi:hypothetical protein